MTTLAPVRFRRQPIAVWIRHPAAITAALVVAAVGLRVWAPSDDGANTVCFVRRCTGTACPGCGLTRAMSYLVRGDLSAMWQMHPLAPLFAVDALVIAGLVWLARSVKVRPRWLALWAALHVPLLLGVWIFRALTGALPA